MSRIEYGVVVDKTSEGCRIEGYINWQTVITVSNRNTTRIFEVSQSKALVGSYEDAKDINKIMTEVLDKVESLREECEGRVSISMENSENVWNILIDGGIWATEKTKDEALSMVKYVKDSYEKRGVIVSCSEQV